MLPQQKRQAVNGLLLLDKPKGLTSNDALQRIKRLYKANKAGHTGSLDPLASGMLPLCLGEATKFSRFLLQADKTYEVTAQLGAATTTGDAEGEVIETVSMTPLSQSQVEAVLQQFIGTVEQIPSMYSAIKYQGEPLYKWARRGIEVPRTPREVTIYNLKLLDLTESQFKLYIHCSKGTYIRTLVEDIAKALNNLAYVAELRRLSVGHFVENEMVPLKTLQSIGESEGQSGLMRYLLPMSYIVKGWEQVEVSPAAAYYLQQGQPVILPYAPPRGWVSLIMKDGRFLGVGEILDDGRVAPRRLAKLS